MVNRRIVLDRTGDLTIEGGEHDLYSIVRKDGEYAFYFNGNQVETMPWHLQQVEAFKAAEAKAGEWHHFTGSISDMKFEPRAKYEATLVDPAEPSPE